jgi:hypothetical protein
MPLILEKNSTNIHEINISSIRETWKEDEVELPIPTLHAISFAELRIIRWSFLPILIATGILIEIRCQNKMISGTFHSINLMLCTFLGGYFLMGCLAPFIPL